MNFDFIQTISCTFNCHIRDLFNWAWSCHGHGLDPAMIGFEFSCHIPNQSKANLKSGSVFPLFLSHAQSWSVFDTMIRMWSDKCVSKARSRKSLWHNYFSFKNYQGLYLLRLLIVLRFLSNIVCCGAQSLTSVSSSSSSLTRTVLPSQLRAFGCKKNIDHEKMPSNQHTNTQ